MTKPEQGKHARTKQRVKAAALLTPAVLTGAAVAFTVAAYQPLVYDPNSIAQVAQAQAQELKTAEAASEKQVANDPVIESNFGMEIGALNDGTYTGSARGYKSVITVSVTVQGGKITAITVVSEGDDEPYFSNARAVIQRVLSSQSMNVDTVSGATYSSTGILMAIKNALLQAAGKAPEAVSAPIAQTGATHAPASDVQAPTGAMKDGEYTGRGMGFNDYVTVSITVQGGKITSVSIVDEDDDEPYFSRAKNGVVPRILTNQNSQVDAVSGATYSSKGIMAAVADAMKKAVAANGAGSGGADGADSSGDGGNGGNTGGSSNPGTPSAPDQPSNPTDPSQPDMPDEQVKYLDGEYTAYAYCADASRPDRYEPYYVALTVVVADGKVSAIKNVHGQATGTVGDAALNPYDEENDEYLNYAVNGRVRKGTTYIGVVNQLLAGKRTAQVDSVSGATYSSQAIAKAYDAALAAAAQAYQEKQQPEGAGGEDSASAGSQAGVAAGSELGVASGSQGAAGNSSGTASASASAGSVPRVNGVSASVSPSGLVSSAVAKRSVSPITPGRWW